MPQPDPLAAILALAAAACSSPEPPPPVPALPGPAAPAPAPVPTPAPGEVSVVFEIVPPGDVGAQRVAVADGRLVWASDRLLPVSTSAWGERAPQAVVTEDGGFITVFEAVVPEGPLRGDVDLMAQRVGRDGALRWGDGERSILLAGTAAVEVRPRLLADGAGGVFVVFERHGRSESGAADTDLAAQRLGADGTIAWGEGDPQGLPIATGPGSAAGASLCSDGAGGLIVAFVDEPADGPAAGVPRLLGQRIGPSGATLWGQGGAPIELARSVGGLTGPVAVPDGQGGALVIFTAGGAPPDRPGDSDLMVQRVAADGSLPWSQTPAAFKVVAATTLAESAAVAIPDGQGGAVAVFEARWLQGEHRGDVDIMAQRIDAVGRGLWNDGAPVGVAWSPWSERAPVLVPDGAGGAIAVFEQHPPAAHLSPDVDIGAQRILADGGLAWRGGTESALVAASVHAEERPAALADGEGGVLVFFEARARQGAAAGEIEIGAQRLGADGQPRWPGGSPAVVAFTAAREQRPAVALP